MLYRTSIPDDADPTTAVLGRPYRRSTRAVDRSGRIATRSGTDAMEASRPPEPPHAAAVLPAALLRVHGTCPAFQNESALDLFE